MFPKQCTKDGKLKKVYKKMSDYCEKGIRSEVSMKSNAFALKLFPIRHTGVY